MKKITINLLSIIILSFVFIPLISSAIGLTDPLGGIDIKDFISKILSYIVKVGGVVATFAFIYTGFLFAFAKGNSGALEKAKSALIGTVIGMAILLGAELIGSMIMDTVSSI
ncbi:MAG: TrbC/VirB2 family protein [Candidatus Paceibacterota bacterium]|jgi:hypothetical protein